MPAVDDLHPEPGPGTPVLGFVASHRAGVWYRRDLPDTGDQRIGDQQRRWRSTYVDRDDGQDFTWAEAQHHGAAGWAALHTEPTPDAYERAMAALHSKDRDIERLQSQLGDQLPAAGDPTKLLGQMRDLDQLRDLIAVLLDRIDTGISPSIPGPTRVVFTDVATERERQDAKHGHPTLPNGTGPEVVLAITGPAAQCAAAAKAATDRAIANGTLTHRLAALEEVLEAVAETDPAALRAELVQAAAYLIKWIEDLDRQVTQ